MRSFITILVAVFAVSSVATADPIRIASFNCSLNRPELGELAANLKSGDAQARKVAKILRITRPDILLLNEFDYDATGESIQVFRRDYLESAGDTAPLKLLYVFAAAVNTGVASSMDLDNDGSTEGPADAFGFGQFPGQYGMVVLSRFPIEEGNVQKFQKLLWSQLPGALRPIDPKTGESWHTDSEWNQLRLSSKSHWVVPIFVNGKAINLIASHPTPPAFDGPEDRNGCRNHDEIRLLSDIISGERPAWLKTDSGDQGGLRPGEAFVICGDLNSDPADGGSKSDAIKTLLTHPRVQKTVPKSNGAVEAAEIQKGANRLQKGDPRHDTADFSDRSVGNLRVDYCLPSDNFRTINSGVFWPSKSEKHANLIDCSDHRLVWVDVESLD